MGVGGQTQRSEVVRIRQSCLEAGRDDKDHSPNLKGFRQDTGRNSPRVTH